MSGAMEQIAHPHHTRSLSGEVHRQTGRRSGKDPSDWVELFGAILQVGARGKEVRCIERGYCGEQDLILAVPEFVLLGTWRQWNLSRGHCGERWERNSAGRGCQRDLLTNSDRTQRSHKEKYADSKPE